MTDNNIDKRAVDCLGRLLEEIGWQPEPIECGSFHIDFGPPYLPISTGFAAITEAKQFIFYLNFGFLVLPERRIDVLRFVSRANWGLIVGNFELDMDDGHLRFKSSVDLDGVELIDSLIRNAILGAMKAVEAHAESLMKIAIPRIKPNQQHNAD